MGDKVYFESLKKKPGVAETPVIVKPDTSKITITAKAASDVNVNVSTVTENSGSSAVDADRLEFTKNEPRVDPAWDDEKVATDHKKILHARRNDRLAEFGVEVPLSSTGATKEEKSDSSLPKISGTGSNS